jgi:hypothetical protein
MSQTCHEGTSQVLDAVAGEPALPRTLPTFVFRNWRFALAGSILARFGCRSGYCKTSYQLAKGQLHKTAESREYASSAATSCPEPSILGYTNANPMTPKNDWPRRRRCFSLQNMDRPAFFRAHHHLGCAQTRMSVPGQTRKYSLRADVFRFTPKDGIIGRPGLWIAANGRGPLCVIKGLPTVGVSIRKEPSTHPGNWFHTGHRSLSRGNWKWLVGAAGH